MKLKSMVNWYIERNVKDTHSKGNNDCKYDENEMKFLHMY